MAYSQLNKSLNRRKRTIYEVGGFLFVILIWTLITSGENPLARKGILPSPGKVLSAFRELIYQNDLIPNLCYSIGLNLGGYIEAILISIPLAFIMGLNPYIRATFERPVDALRFLVLPAAIGLFIAWFGIGSWMKIHFLAFGIIIYLLPVAIQRIFEVRDVYLKTVYTIGASKWQMIKTVYFPSVISSLFSDIRILTAISWTYIVIAESIGGEAGIGALTWKVGLRRARMDKVFCLLFIIMIIGIIQDKIFSSLDKKLFPFKVPGAIAQIDKGVKSIRNTVISFSTQILVIVLILGYLLLFLDQYLGILGHIQLLSYLFRDTIWVIHFIYLLLTGIYIKKWYDQLIKNRQTS